MAMRPSLSGTLKVQRASATLQCDGQTVNLKFTEHT
jgi:hypothetical protein